MDTEKMIEFAQALVQQPSLSGEEGVVAQRVMDMMQVIAAIETLDLPPMH